MDGLVLMSPALRVCGFALQRRFSPLVVFGDPQLVASPFTVRDSPSIDVSLLRRKPWKLRFVLSEDGPVRAILRHGDKVLMWENMRLEPLGLDDLAFT